MNNFSNSVRVVLSHAPAYIKKKVLFGRLYSNSIKRRVLQKVYKKKYPLMYTIKYSNQKVMITKSGEIFKAPLEYTCRLKNGVYTISDGTHVVQDESIKEFCEKVKDKIPEYFGSKYLSDTVIPTLEEFLKLLETLKPINFFNLISQFAASESTQERMALVNAMLELYDCFWTDQLMSMKSVLVMTITEVVGYLVAVYWQKKHFVRDEGKFTSNGEPSAIADFFKNFDISIPAEVSDFGAKIAGGILVILAVVTGGSIADCAKISFTKVFKRVQKFASSIKSLNTMIDGLPKLWTFVMKEVATLFGYTYENEADETTRMFKEELLKFKIEVDRLVNLMNNNPTALIMDAESLFKAFGAMDRLDKLYAKMLKEEKNMSMTKPIFDDIRKNVLAINMFCNNMQASTCRKIEPFMLVLSGAPGIGKSQFVHWFVTNFSAVLHHEFPDLAHWMGTTYNRTSTDKFWPGYTGQMFVVYDDFGQIKMDADHAELILIKNPNKTLLTMSESQEKGRNFSSIGIIGCTNQLELTTSAVVKCTKALDRRFEVAILVDDPNITKFRHEHEEMSPAKWEKVNNATAMILNKHNIEVPYYDENFEHLDFYLMVTEPEEKEYNEKTPRKEITPYEIVYRCLNYYKGFRKDWEKTLVPATSAEIFQKFDSARSSTSNRSKGNYEHAVEKLKRAEILSIAHDVAQHKGKVNAVAKAAEKIKWVDVNLDVDSEVAAAVEEQLKFDIRNHKLKTQEQLPTVEMAYLWKRLQDENAAILKVPKAEIRQEITKCDDAYEDSEDDTPFNPHEQNPFIYEPLAEREVPAPEFDPPLAPGMLAAINPEANAPGFLELGLSPDKLNEANENFMGALDVELKTTEEAIDFEPPMIEGEPVVVTDESVDPVESSKESFVKSGHDKGRIFCLQGAPGTGKTTLMRYVQNVVGQKISVIHANELHNLVHVSPVLYIEDISVTEGAFKTAKNLIMQCYDGVGPVQVIYVSMNEQMARSYCKTQEEWDAFCRRMKIFQFEYQIKSNWTRARFSARDVEAALLPYGKMISIHTVDVTPAGKRKAYIDSAGLGEYLIKQIDEVEFTRFARVVTRSVPYIGRNQFDPEFKFKIKGNSYEKCEAMYKKPMLVTSWMATGQAQLVKGGYGQALNLAAQFTGLNGKQPDFPKSMDEFVVMINNAEFKSEMHFVAELEFDDCSLCIMPKLNDPRVIRCFKICDRMEISPQGELSSGDSKAMMNTTTYDVYTDYISNAQAISKKLQKALKTTEKQADNSIGFMHLFKRWPKLNNFVAILMFVLKMLTGGMSIMTLWEMNKSRIFMNVEDEISKSKKKAKKTGFKPKKGKIGRLSNVKFTRWEYEQLKTAYVTHASTCAQKRGLQYCIEDYMDIVGIDYLPVGEPGFNAYLKSYDECIPFAAKTIDEFEMEDREKEKPKDKEEKFTFKEFEAESGQPEIVKQQPKVEIMPGLMFENKKPKEKITIKKDAPRGKESCVLDESLIDPSARASVDLFERQTVDIGYGNCESSFTRICYGIMVKGKVGVTVAHIRDPSKTLAVRVYKGVKAQIFPIDELKVIEAHDLLIFRIDGKSCPNYPSIIHHMPTFDFGNFETMYKGKRGILATYERHMEGAVRRAILRNIRLDTLRVVFSSTTKKQKQVYAYTGFVEAIQAKDAINTTYGDCGSALFANDTSVAQKLIGFHNAGSTEFGCCTLLFQDYFKKLNFAEDESITLKSVPVKAHNIPYRKFTEEFLMGMPIKADLKKRKSFPTKSKFYTSPLKLPEENPFQPSVLSDRDPRDKSGKHPYFHAISKWNKVPAEVDEKLIDEVADDIAYWYSSVCKQEGCVTKVLTKTEAINAGKQYEINPLNRNSSPGVPWNEHEKKVKDFFCDKGGKGQAYYGINRDKKSGEKLNHSIDEIIQICRTPGEYPNVVFAGTLKDEPVKMSKIEDVNTRSFAGAPLDYTIASRMYFATIQGAIHQVRDKMPIQIGIDPTSLEWDRMIRRLLSKSDKGFDLDFKGWDGCVHPAFTKRLHKIYNRIAQLTNDDWIEEDDTIRENLCRACVEPLIQVIMDETTYIVRAPGGMVSGSPRTADDNSLLHLMKFLYCLKKILRRHGLTNVDNIISIIEMIDMIIYGDDGGYAIHPLLLEFINFKTMQEEFAKIGMICTPAAKNGKEVDVVDVLDLEFLKRSTVRLGAKYYGALHKITFHKMLGYCLGTPPHHWWKDREVSKYNIEDLRQTANAALQESIFHGKEFYAQMAEHLTGCFQRIGETQLFPRFADLVRMRELPIPLM